jgi:hypothetical protein
MIWKNTMKYPVLAIGVILFGLFITDPKTKKFWENSKRRFIPSTCDAVKDRVEIKSPQTWELECPGTQLLIIKIQHDPAGRNLQVLRSQMYKNLANSYANLARFSNPETLSYLKFIELIVEHPRLTIRSKTDGQAVVEMLKLKTQSDIANHLKLTVKVRETKH